MRMPRPKTSTKTPWIEILGAKVFDRILKRRKASSFEERVEVKIGQGVVFGLLAHGGVVFAVGLLQNFEHLRGVFFDLVRRILRRGDG